MAGSSRVTNLARRLVDDGRGSIAPIFAIASLPLMIMVGSSVDFSRMTNAEARLQSASDTSALLISKEIEKGTSPSEIKTKLKDVLKTALKEYDIKSWSGDYTWDAKSSTVEVVTNAEIDTTFLGIAGIKTLAFGARATAVNGADILEIAMVLDNTGSMSSSGKITQLKSAAKSMISELAKTISGKAGKAYVSIVPFSVPVRVSTSLDSVAWLGARETVETCTGSGKKKVCTTSNKTWSGCIGDRVSPSTVSVTLPVAGATLFPRYYGTCDIATLTPLTNDLTAAGKQIDNMIASGNTNIPVGLAWGWNMLTPGMTLSNSQTGGQAKKVLRYAILLTDGDNTQNTLGNGTSAIDTLTADTCTAIKKAGITIFSIRVIDGNADLLKKCATSPSYYFDVSNPATLTSVFKQILSNITKLRLAA